jgi:hypothetical protein
MTSIFVLYTSADAPCAEAIHTDLEAKGYRVWRKPESLQISDILYPRTIENSILGSAAVILVWSSSAAQSAEIERHLLLAQRLKKLLIPVVLDSTSLPNTLVAISPLTAQASCTDIVVQLMQQPLLPPPQSNDPLITLSELAIHEHISKRKAAIDQAAEMLQRGEQREAVLALLEYLAQKDLMMGVREKAKEVIDADVQRQAPHPPFSFNPADSRYIFGARCKNGHVTYFDKRRVCNEQSRVVRRGVTEPDELELKCETCGEFMTVRVDCEGCK